MINTVWTSLQIFVGVGERVALCPSGSFVSSHGIYVHWDIPEGTLGLTNTTAYCSTICLGMHTLAHRLGPAGKNDPKL